MKELNAHLSQTVPLNYYGESVDEPSTSTFKWVSGEVIPPFYDLAETIRWQGEQDAHQSNPGPMGTVDISTERFQPYATSSSSSLEHWNAEVDPSTLLPQQTPYVGSPTLQPTGGIIPEPTADAVTNQTNTDEDEVPVSNLYRSHIPHVPEWSFGVSHPSEPGSPRAKGDIAGAVSRHKVTPANCVSGCRDGRSSGYCRARTML